MGSLPRLRANVACTQCRTLFFTGHPTSVNMLLRFTLPLTSDLDISLTRKRWGQLPYNSLARPFEQHRQGGQTL